MGFIIMVLFAGFAFYLLWKFVLKWGFLFGEKIVDEWSTVIEGAHAKGDYLFETTQKFLEEAEAPGVTWEMAIIYPEFIATQGQRSFLRVKNALLKDFQMYIGARDYGTSLDVAWYLTVEPRLIKRVLSKMTTSSEQALSFQLDIFKKQDLRAYATVVHHCLMKTVKMIAEEQGKDFSRFNMKSKGFLEVW